MAEFGGSWLGIQESSYLGRAKYGIFVKNLPVDTTTEELGAVFVSYGEVQDAVVVCRPEFRTHAYGYVLLDTDDGTRRAIQKLNLTLLRGKMLRMEPTFGRTNHLFRRRDRGPENTDHTCQPRQVVWDSDVRNEMRHQHQNQNQRFNRAYQHGGGNGGCNVSCNVSYNIGQYGGYRCNSGNGSCYKNSVDYRSDYGKNGSNYRGPRYNSGTRGDDCVPHSTRRKNYLPDEMAWKISQKLRASWERHLASVPDPEEWPSFDELLDSVRDVPYTLNSRPRPVDSDGPDEQSEDQPAFYSDSFVGEDEALGGIDVCGYSFPSLKEMRGDGDSTIFLKRALEGATAGSPQIFQGGNETFECSGKTLVSSEDEHLKKAIMTDVTRRAPPFGVTDNDGKNAPEYLNDMLLENLEFPTYSTAGDDSADHVCQENCESNSAKPKCEDRALRERGVDAARKSRGSGSLPSSIPTGKALFPSCSQTLLTPDKPNNVVNLMDGGTRATKVTGDDDTVSYPSKENQKVTIIGQSHMGLELSEKELHPGNDECPKGSPPTNLEGAVLGTGCDENVQTFPCQKQALENQCDLLVVKRNASPEGERGYHKEDPEETKKERLAKLLILNARSSKCEGTIRRTDLLKMLDL